MTSSPGVTDTAPHAASTGQPGHAPAFGPPSEHADREAHPIRALALTTVVGLLMRVLLLGSFPVLEPDEGLWTRSAKNFLLFGDWFLDAHTHLVLAPAFHVLQLPVHALLGPGLVSARVMSAVFGALTIPLVYLLVRRLGGGARPALWAAIVVAFCPWAVLTSRKALLESTQTFWVVLAAVLMVGRGWRAAAAAGVAFAVAMLVKPNAIFLGPVFGLWLLYPAFGRASLPAARRAAIVRGLAFGAVALGLAAAGFGWLYLAYPDQFVSSYAWEMSTKDFEPPPHVLFQSGRFGIHPGWAGKTLVELLRLEPFMLVLAVLGSAVVLVRRPPGAGLYLGWFFGYAAAVLLQTVQPLRYFYALMPAAGILAAFALDWVARGDVAADARALRIGRLALGMLLAFDLAYFGMYAATNREVKLGPVRSWAQATLAPDDRVLTSAYFATDLPQRAYGHYKLVSSADEIPALVERLGIGWIVVDDQEWPPAYRDLVASRYTLVREWPFGAAYRTGVPRAP